MGEKMSKEDIPKKSMLLELEDAVLKIEAAGYNEQEIFSFVNMILRGFITNGTWTKEYLQYCADLIEQQRRQDTSRTLSAPPAILGANGLALKK